jgi:murein DD-endopeptidase MepM/ murein hydrolase activator NlpD
MTRRFLTLLIVGHAAPRLRRMRLSYSFVGVLALLVAALVVSGLCLPGLWYRAASQSVAIEVLRHENERLRAEREYFEGSLAVVSERLDLYEAQAGRLGEELSVPGMEALDWGVGGGTDTGAAPQRFWFEDDLRGLESRAERLDHSVEQLGEAFVERRSRLAATPNMMPVQGWFSHGYGWRKDPIHGGREFHRGIDIVAPAGTEIRAPADGVIVRSGRFPQLGRSLDIAHGFGFVTRYAHMSELRVRAGERVRRGDVIGLVGSTGRSTGPHLHYEVFRDGRRVNPWSYLGQSSG